jgi:pilus assembly protein CpaB
MRVLIVGIIVLSLGVAGVATYLITTFKTPEAIDKLQEEKAPLKIKVLVANQDLPIGAVLTEQAMSWQAWVEEALNEQFTAVDNEELQAERMREFAGGIVRRVIRAGEPILASKLFKRDEPGFLAGMLEPGMRAVTAVQNVLQ